VKESTMPAPNWQISVHVGVFQAILSSSWRLQKILRLLDLRVPSDPKHVQKKTKKVVDTPLHLWNSFATHGNIQIQNNMRTKTLLAAAAMLAAGFASSMAQSNVYSLNVVGYVNYTFVGGGLFTATANPLNTSSNTLAGIFGTGSPLTGLPAGSQVQKWDYTLQDFVPYTKTPVGSGWGANAAVPIVPGQAVFVKITGASYTNTYVGEVLQGNLTNATLANFNFIGNLVPDSGTATQVGLVPAAGAQVQKWSTSLQDFVLSSKTPIGWSGAGEPSFAPGDGFFLKNNAAYNWVRNFTVQ